MFLDNSNISRRTRSTLSCVNGSLISSGTSLFCWNISLSVGGAGSADWDPCPPSRADRFNVSGVILGGNTSRIWFWLKGFVRVWRGSNPVLDASLFLRNSFWWFMLLDIALFLILDVLLLGNSSFCWFLLFDRTIFMISSPSLSSR